MKKRYSYRAYLDEAAQAKARRLFGCCRVVQNVFLTERNRLYALGLHRLVGFEVTAKQVTTLAKRTEKHAFLAEVSAVALQQAVADEQRAFRNWFGSLSGKRRGRKVRPPAFKRKSHRQSARFTRNARFKVLPTPGSKWGKVEIPSIGIVRFRKSRDLPSDPSSVTLIANPDGTWQVSFVVGTARPERTPVAHPGRIAAVDAGFTHLATIVYSDGTREKVDNPRHLKDALRRLRRQQRHLARCEKGSRNREKARLRVAKTHAHVAAKRADHHRKLAARLARENGVVVREDLCLYGLGRTRLSKSAHDAALGMLFTHLTEAMKTRNGETQADATSRNVRVIGRWEPTTQTCSVCGAPGGKKPLSVRVWTCEGCGARLDRDYNAALNIMLAAGLAHCLPQGDAVDVLTSGEGAESLNACGGNVRLALASAVPDEAGTPRTTPGNAAPAA